jgi:hypothetical protein
MKSQNPDPLPPWALLAGDALVLLLVTLVGFGTHNSNLDGGRWLTTFVPLCTAWGLVAPWLGNYQPPYWRVPWQAWRALLAMVLAAPLAAFLRAVLLNGVVIPIFVVALGGVAALSLALWRVVWAFLARRGFAWTNPN